MARDDRGSDDRRLMRAADRLDIPRELRRTIVRRRAYDAGGSPSASRVSSAPASSWST
jgi:hypothetical protein